MKNLLLQKAQFKSVAEIKKEILEKIPLEVRVHFLVPVNGKKSIRRERWLHEKAEEKYHKQFDDFIEKVVPVMAASLARVYTKEAGLSEKDLEIRPKNIWEVNKVYKHTPVTLTNFVKKDLTKNLSMPAYAVDINNKFVFIDPKGRSAVMNFNPAESGRSSVLLKILGIKTYPSIGLYLYITSDVTARANTENRSIGQLSEDKITHHIVKNIRELEHEHDPDEWGSKFEGIKEILEYGALAAGLIAGVVMPELLPAEIELAEAAEAVEAGEVVGEGIAAGEIASAAEASVLDEAETNALLREVQQEIDEASQAAGNEVAQAEAEEQELSLPQADELAPELPNERVLAAERPEELAREKTESVLLGKPGNSESIHPEQAAAETSEDLNAVVSLEPQAVQERVYAGVGKLYRMSPEEVAAEVDKGAAIKVGKFVYRGNVGKTLEFDWGTGGGQQLDDRLIRLLQHSGSRVGSARASFSTSGRTASEFAQGRPDGHLLQVETDFNHAGFRPMADILRTEGPRLVSERKISIGTYRSALEHFISGVKTGKPENEVVYVGEGNIPTDRVRVVQPFGFG